MPTNEERREVAARLRVLASHVTADAELVLDALDLYEGEYIEGFNPRCVDRLADLIEPEPDRTCRWEHIEGTWFMSECGERYDRVIPDNFCPNCGAKVVSDD